MSATDRRTSLESQPNDGQVVSDRMTAVILLLTTALTTYSLYRLTKWDYRVWWRAGLLLVGGYLVAAVFLMGINGFAGRAYQEYQRLLS